MAPGTSGGRKRLKPVPESCGRPGFRRDPSFRQAAGAWPGIWEEYLPDGGWLDCLPENGWDIRRRTGKTGLEIPAGIRYSKSKIQSFYSNPIFISICIHIKSDQRIPMAMIWMTN